MDKNSEIVEYFVVNKELGMSPQKAAAQVAHVATMIAIKYQKEEDFKTWYDGSQTTVILQGKEKDLKKLIEQGFDFTIDEGRTEIPENSLTVVGLKPMTREQSHQYVKRLRLYR